jgi:predicted HTH domain antitoxin
MSLTIELPKGEQEALEPYRDRLGELLRLGLSQVRIHEALLLYERRAASLGRAIELAGVTREEFIRQARAAGIGPTVDAGMAAEELACRPWSTPARSAHSGRSGRCRYSAWCSRMC